MNRGNIGFVVGTDAVGAKPPHDFPYRFAVLCWLENEDGMMDPWPLLRLASPKILSLVGADSITVEFSEQVTTGIIFQSVTERVIRSLSWAELITCPDQTLSEDEFPSYFRFEREQRPVLLAQSEMWSMVGGPYPYHDSVTLSFFSNAPLQSELTQIFTEAATALDVSVDETISKI